MTSHKTKRYTLHNTVARKMTVENCLSDGKAVLVVTK